jgi:hypothetical protein
MEIQGRGKIELLERLRDNGLAKLIPPQLIIRSGQSALTDAQRKELQSWGGWGLLSDHLIMLIMMDLLMFFQREAI